MSHYNFGLKGVARRNFGIWRVSKWGC